MSCLIHALLPANLAGTDSELEPDKNGGFELGTWNFFPYLEFFSKAIGKKVDFHANSRADLNGRPMGCIYVFSKEECQLIVSALKSKRVRQSKLFKSEKYYVIGRCGFFQEPMRLKKKWMIKLVELFSSGNVCYYCR
jgi:hypothetical protein